MAHWTVERMTEELKKALQQRLVGVLLYGSGAAGDHAGKHSDYNLMVITHELQLNDLQNLSKAVVHWAKQGNPAPLLVTREELRGFVDVFPIEVLDIKENHRVLFGEDPFPGLKVSQGKLRLELEHELQGKILQLKTKFMFTGGKSKKVKALLIDSLATFLVLFKSALWFFKERPPARKMDALRKLQEKIPFDIGVFQTVERLKRGERIDGSDPSRVFEKYLETIEAVADRIIQKPKGRSRK